MGYGHGACGHEAYGHEGYGRAHVRLTLVVYEGCVPAHAHAQGSVRGDDHSRTPLHMEESDEGLG